MLCLSLLFFSISGIQYWITDYMIETLKEPESSAHLNFGVTAITSPILGALASGWFGSKIKGGYSNKWAIPSCILAALICCLISIPVPFYKDFQYFIISIWFMLFCGGYLLPITTGVMLETISVDLRPQANSLANMSYNLLGYLPSPALYGTFSDPRKGFGMLVYSTWVAMIFLILGWLSMKKKGEEAPKVENVDATENEKVPVVVGGFSVGLDPSVIGIGMTKSLIRAGPDSPKSQS